MTRKSFVFARGFASERASNWFTQFSYANWAGNPGDEEEHRRQAFKKREQIALQAEQLRPSIITPFASFVWFSHKENFFHNAQMNQVADIAHFIETELGRRALVMYPGDAWRYGEPHDDASARARYARDFHTVTNSGPADSSKTVPRDSIMRVMDAFLKRVKTRNPVIRFVPGLTTRVLVTDWCRAFELGLSGMHEVQSPSTVDVELGSDSLYFALKTPWGANALAVNGRYIAPANGDATRFFRFFRAADLNDHGHYFDYRWAAGQAAKAITRRTSALIGTR